MPRFEILDHTADIGVVAYGADLKSAFTTAAYAMFSLIADLDLVNEVTSREMAIEEEEQDSLLVAWLNELLYLCDTESLLFKRFEITELSETRLKAKGYGERIDRSRHRLKSEVKAATYHLLKLSKEDGFKVQVIFDV